MSGRMPWNTQPDSILCPCGCGEMQRVGESRTERLDVIPAQFRVLVTVRPKYVCRACAGAQHAQAPAPEWLVPRGLPTEALVAHSMVAKFGDYLPFYRQADIYRRQGIDLDRTMLAEWSGRAAQLLAPVIDAMMAELRRSDRLQMDETVVPVLAPGTGAVRKDWLWVVLRDQRGWGGTDPPIVVFHHSQSRGGKVAQEILKGFAGGTLLVDGHAGYDVLADPKSTAKPWAVAYCWTHWRRRFVKFSQDTPSPICDEMIARIAQLYAIEKQIRGRDPATRLAIRQKVSKPIVEALRPWLEGCLQDLSSANELARHIRYGLKRWDGMTRFLEDGRLEMDTNGVENAIRPIPLTRKNALFAGSIDGADLGPHRLADRHLPAERGEPRGLYCRDAPQDHRPAHAARHRQADALELRRIVKPPAEGGSAGAYLTPLGGRGLGLMDLWTTLRVAHNPTGPTTTAADI